MRLTLPLVFLIFLHSSAFAGLDEVITQAPSVLAKELTQIVNASPLKRIPPKYPIAEARAGRDGWVRLSYIVEPDGTTSNPIVESSSGSKHFEKQAINAVQRWEFEPARENGKKIQQCNNNVQLDFKMHRSRDGVSKKFKRLYDKFAQVLDKKETEEIEEYGQRLENYKIFTARETYYQYALLSEYYRYKGDKTSELTALNRAFSSTGSSGLFARLAGEKSLSAEGFKLKGLGNREEKMKKVLKNSDAQTAKLLPTILHKKLMLELDFAHLSDALNTVDKLILLSEGMEWGTPYLKQKQAIETLISSDKYITTQAEVGDGLFWRYRLLRNEFSFTDINGRLLTLDVRCENKRHLYTINNQSKWTIPNTWQGCSLYVKGEKGSRFTLVEYPSSLSKHVG